MGSLGVPGAAREALRSQSHSLTRLTDTWYARWAQTENTGEHGCTGAHGLSLSLGEEQVHRQQKLAATCLWADELCGFPDFSYEGCRTVVVLPLLIALIAALSWNGTTEA